jgi:predicted DCC family thiol-disulfide oxidoreductase YuxK
MKRPLLIYDGDCTFCTRWVERWRLITGDRVEYRISQDAARDFPEIAPEAFARSVQFIDPNGRRSEGAEAVFRSLATATLWGRALLRAHGSVPGFAAITEACYRVVASNREFFSKLTRLLWGRDVTPPSYAISTTIFLRLLGAIYLLAFISYGLQARGLVGAHGILPTAQILPQVHQMLGSDAWHLWPTLLWLRLDDAMIFGLVWAGGVCAVLILLGMVQPLALLGAWAAYLSLVVAGQDFYSFQWDILLLEAGLLAIFLAPWSWRPTVRPRAPGRLARFLLIWLLFRLMFSSGVVKLSSGDPTWSHLTALEFHYWTQPLPNPIAWFFAQAPGWFQTVSAAGMFVVELGLPFLVFLSRRPRMIAFWGFLGLQAFIEITGNFGFFNLLTIGLALLLVDDAIWPAALRNARGPAIRWTRWVLPLPAIAYIAMSLVPLAGAFRTIPGVLAPLAIVYEQIAPFRSINGYGLFATMTTSRPEITIQGSMDGVNWVDYVFKYKPGPLHRPPPFVAPYMPRLDWQMWFAALQDVRGTPWMGLFVQRLFEAQPDVLALLALDPFGGKPPRYLRGQLDNYSFTTFAEKRSTGDWWKKDPAAIYFPEISRDEFGR